MVLVSARRRELSAGLARPPSGHFASAVVQLCLPCHRVQSDAASSDRFLKGAVAALSPDAQRRVQETYGSRIAVAMNDMTQANEKCRSNALVLTVFIMVERFPYPLRGVRSCANVQRLSSHLATHPGFRPPGVLPSRANGSRVHRATTMERSKAW